MVENRPLLTVFTHAVLIAGVAAIAFPLYVTFIASSLTLDEILAVPMPLTPGHELAHNYGIALAAGSAIVAMTVASTPRESPASGIRPIALRVCRSTGGAHG